MKLIKMGRGGNLIAFLAACSTMASVAFAADISYSAKPETEPIVVASGDEAETLGVRALRDQIYHWTFDDAEKPLVDVVSGVSLAPADFVVVNTNSTRYSRTDDPVKMGDGAMKAKGDYVLGLRPVPTALQGGSPFTVMGWFRLGELTASNPNNAFFYLGDSAASTNKPCARSLLSNSDVKISVGATESTKFDIDPAGSRWMHVALVYTPSSGSIAASLKAYSDGHSGTYTYRNRPEGNVTGKETRDGISLTDETDVFVIGGAKYQAYPRYLGNGNVVDEVRVFSRALTGDEIAWFRDNTHPFDFSAEWRVDAGGTLDLYGSSNQVVNGYGAVSSDKALTLAPTNDAYFGGTLSGAGLQVAAADAATQTFSGAGSYSGKTVLTSGTTVFRPAAKLPTALADGLIGYWTFDDPTNPGYDLSGYGNDLVATTNILFDTISSDVPGGGRALDFSLPLDTTDRYYAYVAPRPSHSIVNGLVKANDYGCAVTIAVWTKIRLPQSIKRNGIAGFEDGCGFGMAVENRLTANEVTFGGRGVGGATRCTLADSDGDITNAVHLYVATFNPLLAADESTKASAGAFYFDGVKKGDWGQSINSEINTYYVGRERFALGLGVYTSGHTINAIYDQAMLFNRALNADEVAELCQFGQRTTPSAATGLLPGTTELAIGEEAKAVFENANETVAGLSGAGELEIGGTAQLAVTNTFSFTGTVKGAGRLVLGDELTFVLPQVEVGTFNIVTAPTGVLQLPASLEAWTVEDAPAKTATTFRLVEDAQTGTETLVAKIAKCGFIIVFR